MDMLSDPRTTPEGLLKVSRRLFLIGFFGLPLVWLLNYVYLFPYLRKPTTPANTKWFAHLSLLFFAMEAFVLVTWITIFLIFHNSMGPHGQWGDWISLRTPYGY